MSLNPDKIELEFVTNILNSKKKYNKFNFFLILMFLINFILYTYFGFTNKNETLFNLIIASIWGVGTGINIYGYIKNKKFIKNLQEEQNRLLKKTDYNKYIKKQRKSKLRKIKKNYLKW